MKKIPSVLRRSRRPAQTRSFANGAPYVPSLTTAAGETVTEQTALTFTAVFAAINCIATDIASLPAQVVQRQPNGTDVPCPTMPQQRLLSVSPNEGESNAYRAVQASMGHTLGWGNSYRRIVRDGGGLPVEFKLLHPRTTRAKRTKSGQLYYEVDDGREPPVIPENMLHVAGLGFDGLTGYSPIIMGREAVGLGKGAEVFGAAFFGNGATAGGWLKTPKKLTQTAAGNLRTSFNRRHQGPRNAHVVGILEEGMEWVSNQVAPEAAQFLQTRAFQILEVARMFRVPPHKIGDYSQSHLANLEESNLDYLQTTLLGWVVAIEAELNLKLFTEDEIAEGYHVLHDFTALLRGNMTARSAYWTAMKQAGVVCSDTIAAKEGLPLPGEANGGHLYLTQKQNVPQQQAGQFGKNPRPFEIDAAADTSTAVGEDAP